MDKIALGIFVIELIIKLIVYRINFFKNGWNVFDFIIVSIALIPSSGSLSILRAFRIFRALRLLSVVPSMKKVIQAMFYAIPGIASVGTIILLIFYISSVLVTNFFGTRFEEWFGTIGNSMYSLFQIMTLESWSMGIVRPVMQEYPYAWVFFVPFILITTFAVLNLFIGIIVDAMQKQTDENESSDKEKSNIIFDNKGKKLETSILDGNCKLQWKVDWAMRWYALDIDFEMYGKDLIESAILSTKIINLLGKKNPSGFAYELFLDEKGEKISKSKGNGITIDQWLEYASPESLSLYMYQNPKRAKKLYKEIVPKAVDEYLDCIEKSKKQNELQLLMNPVWHVHNGNIPNEEMIMTFSMLLNLVETSNADNKDLLWKFVKKYKPDISETNFPIFDALVGYAIKYFNDVIKAQKKYKTPNESEKKALEALVKTLEKCTDEMSPEDIQTLIYSTGKENGYADNLRDWFKLIYEVVFGDENGPRMGFFISFFGVKETTELLMNKLK